MTEGGTLWFTDLTVADPTYLLPALAGATFLLTVELGAADGMQGQVGATSATHHALCLRQHARSAAAPALQCNVCRSAAAGLLGHGHSLTCLFAYPACNLPPPHPSCSLQRCRRR